MQGRGIKAFDVLFKSYHNFMWYIKQTRLELVNGEVKGGRVSLRTFRVQEKCADSYEKASQVSIAKSYIDIRSLYSL